MDVLLVEGTALTFCRCQDGPHSGARCIHFLGILGPMTRTSNPRTFSMTNRQETTLNGGGRFSPGAQVTVGVGPSVRFLVAVITHFETRKIQPRRAA